MRCHRYVGLYLGVVFGLLLDAHGAVAEFTFRPLPPQIAGGSSAAASVSDDGSTVVGAFLPEDSVGGFPAVASLWKLPEATIQNLQDPGLLSGRARDVSADGRVAAGWFVRPDTETWFNFGFRWTATGGMVPLAPLEPEGSTVGLGVSGDGNVVVGLSAADGLYRATVWTGDEAPKRLNDLGIPGVSSAVGASFDGTTIVGTIGQSAAIWREGVDEPILLRFNPNQLAHATDVSPNGKFVVGLSGLQTFLYSDELGMIDLGGLEGYQTINSASVSGDGRFVAGIAANTSTLPNEFEAVIRGPAGRWRTLEELLESHGTQIDWDLQGIVEMTPDGRTLVGFGLNESGVQQSWAVTVPEPTALTLAGIVVSAVLSVHMSRLARYERRVRHQRSCENSSHATSIPATSA